MALVTKENWEGFCRHTETAEKQYWEKDGIISEVRDCTVINLSCGNDSDSDCDNSDVDPHCDCDCDDSETDIECSNIMPDEDRDMELAQPP
jgi:hypothetical protein